ncbi:hypothetical protein OQA88_5509 [Cercophora sp. LCS_1]
MKKKTTRPPHSESTEALNPTICSESQAQTDSVQRLRKKSFADRYRHVKPGKRAPFSDDELKKYTGMTLAEIMEWAKDRPGVAGNPPAGKRGMGFGAVQR